jgi:hypothetical protein
LNSGFVCIVPWCSLEPVSTIRASNNVKRPFESWTQIDAVAEQLGPVYGPMIVFASATGLRPGEWLAERDGDAAAVSGATPPAENRRGAGGRGGGRGRPAEEPGAEQPPVEGQAAEEQPAA